MVISCLKILSSGGPHLNQLSSCVRRSLTCRPQSQLGKKRKRILFLLLWGCFELPVCDSEGVSGTQAWLVTRPPPFTERHSYLNNLQH